MTYIKKIWDGNTFQKGDKELINGLNHIEEGLANIEGGGAIVDWSPTMLFAKNNLVVIDGEIYKSLVDNNIGHNPKTDLLNWVRLQHVIEYKQTLPTADETSVTFVEVDGQLYYKTNNTNSNETNSTNSNGYQYKPVSSGGPTPQAGVIDVLVDGKSAVNENKIAQIIPTLRVYSPSKIYGRNELVTNSGLIFKSLVDDNIGHQLTEDSYWLNVTEIIRHVDELPLATMYSPNFLEYNNNLYYKSEHKASGRISFSYQQVGGGSGGASDTQALNLLDSKEESPIEGIDENQFSVNKEVAKLIKNGFSTWNENANYSLNDYVNYNGKLFKSKTNDNTFNTPSTGINDYWEQVAFSYKTITAEEISKTADFSYAEDTLYFVTDFKIYADCDYFSLNGLGEAMGYEIRPKGIYLDGSLWHDYKSLPDYFEEIRIYLESNRNGKLSVGYLVTSEGNRLVTKYDEEWVDQLNWSLKFYNYNVGLIEIANSSGNSKAISITSPRYSLEKNVLMRIINEHDLVLAVSGFTGEPEKVEYLRENSLFNSSITEVPSIAYYENCHYSATIDLSSGLFILSEKEQVKGTTVITTLLTTLTSEDPSLSDRVEFPALGFTPIQQILDAIKTTNVLVKADDRVYQVKYAKGTSSKDAEVVLEYYEPIIKDNILINYKTDPEKVTTTLTPVHYISFTYTHLQPEGTLPANMVSLLMHNDNHYNAVFYYILGSDYKKKVKLTFETQEDRLIYYKGGGYVCEIDCRDMHYIFAEL